MDVVIIIIAVVIGLAGMIAGGVYWKKFKDIVAQVKVILQIILDAVEDDKITREELDIIVKEAKELFELFKTDAPAQLKRKVELILSKKLIKKNKV